MVTEARTCLTGRARALPHLLSNPMLQWARLPGQGACCPRLPLKFVAGGMGLKMDAIRQARG